MADKTYKMIVTLSDGSTVDAGTFVAPQGPQGPQGGSLSWSAYTTFENFVLPEVPGVYLIDMHNIVSNNHSVHMIVKSQGPIRSLGLLSDIDNGRMIFRDFMFGAGIIETYINYPESDTSAPLNGSQATFEVPQLSGYRFAYSKLIDF